MKMAENSPEGYKTLWEKEKLAVMSNFSFSNNVVKRLVWERVNAILLPILIFGDHPWALHIPWSLQQLPTQMKKHLLTD